MIWRSASLQVLSRLQEEVERLFQEAMELADDAVPTGGWQPRLDIVETESSLLLLLEVPGFRSADLKVEVEGNQINITGSRSAEHPEGRFLCIEREHGKFTRRVKLFWPVNGHRGRARLARGLLILELPKIEDKRRTSRRLEIEELSPEAEGALP